LSFLLRCRRRPAGFKGGARRGGGGGV
jgi:hypothetical protein